MKKLFSVAFAALMSLASISVMAADLTVSATGSKDYTSATNQNPYSAGGMVKFQDGSLDILLDGRKTARAEAGFSYSLYQPIPVFVRAGLGTTVQTPKAYYALTLGTDDISIYGPVVGSAFVGFRHNLTNQVHDTSRIIGAGLGYKLAPTTTLRIAGDISRGTSDVKTISLGLTQKF